MLEAAKVLMREDPDAGQGGARADAGPDGQGYKR
jgi:hypothetical protein